MKLDLRTLTLDSLALVLCGAAAQAAGGSIEEAHATHSEARSSGRRSSGLSLQIEAFHENAELETLEIDDPGFAQLDLADDLLLFTTDSAPGNFPLSQCEAEVLSFERRERRSSGPLE